MRLIPRADSGAACDQDSPFFEDGSADVVLSPRSRSAPARRSAPHFRVVLVALSCGGALLFPRVHAAEGDEGPSLGKIASLQNQVETRPARVDSWSASLLDQPLYARYRVRTGPSSRAGILYSDQTLHRLNERSEIEILAPTAEKPGLISLLLGAHYFSSRAPKQFGRIETPVVTAAIRGTEFVVEVDGDTTTRITMLEGSVEASNTYGSLSVQTGEQAYVEPGKAPVKRIVVRPRDAVAWALYYPPVLGGADARHLQELGPDGQDLAQAAALLSAGQVGRAAPLIEAARGRHPDDPVALALASVIQLAANEKDKALRTAEMAVSANPSSAAACLALSFAAQASFDIPRAREMAERAAQADPESSVALARVAELRMAEGDPRGAEDAARRAVTRTPGEPRALAVLGFVQLAQFRSEEAERSFQEAVPADPSFALARLGLGLARIRRGNLSAGRAEIQTAVALDPNDSLLRSYLAKAYYEEKRPAEAGKELAAAKELDPADPTPYLYDAIRKQNENRPAEALQDLRTSIGLNDMRAVYRSRLLLDEDRAVRGTDLARIYNDLGFNRLGMVAARRSADEDQSNYSSHLFLAGSYRNVPDFAPAFLSEVLQARIYQPVSVNAARPDVVNETVTFNEYTALFDRPRARAFGGVTSGITDSVQKDDSMTGAGEVTGTLNGDRYAAAMGYRKFSTDGFRFNNDQAIANYRAFVEFSPTYRDSVQANVLVSQQESGDLPLGFVPTTPTLVQFDTRLRNIGLGYHRVFSAGADFVVSAIDNRTLQTATFTDPFTLAQTVSQEVLEGPQLEVQQVFRREKTTWTLGAGGFRGTITLKPSLQADDRFANGYGYLTLRPARLYEITLGAAYEDVVSPTGLEPPDPSILPADLEFSKSRVSPKFGITFHPHPKTTLRAALYHRLNPTIGRIQTLEPTQVAGFNQFFFEPGGTRSRSYGVGIDQEFTPRLFAGFSFLRRKLKIPEAFCSSPDPFFFTLTGCEDPITGGPRPAEVLVDRESRDVDGSAYINAVAGKRWALALDYSLRRSVFNVTMENNTANVEDRLETHRAQPQVRWFLPNGWFATIAGTYYRQRVDEHNVFPPPATLDVKRVKFWIVDVSVGYRLPRRYGSVLVESRNVRNKQFPFFEREIEDTFIPARQIAVSLNFTL